MQQVNLDKVYANLKARGIRPSIDVQSFTKLGPKTFKMVAAVRGIDGEDSFADEIAAITDGSARVISGTFKKSDRMVVAIVAANVKSKPMDASFQQVTASTARSVDGTIWTVVNDDSGKRVMLESSDDLGDILKSRVDGRRVFALPSEAASIICASVSNGDIVRYVDVATNEYAWGIAVHAGQDLTVIGEDLMPRDVATHSVFATVSRKELPEMAEVIPFAAHAKLDGAKLTKVLDYLKTAWAKTPISNEMLEKYRRMAAKAA